MAEILEITPETLDATVAQDKIVLVDAWAAWCGPCRGFAPVFEKVAAKHQDHVFVSRDQEH